MAGVPRVRGKAFVVSILASVLAFAAGNIAVPLTARYVPLLGERLDQLAGVDPLVVRSSWPTVPGCDLRSAVAMPAGGPPVESLAFRTEEDVRVTAVGAGAGSWLSGVLGITFSTRESVRVQIDAIDITPLTKDTDRPVDWILRVDDGCGPGKEMDFTFDLDDSLFVEEGRN
jgi:hypothetical protein